ncbi:hypothetical protein A0O36_00973 [Piscirickettsiaceae bacterium NZ-RLO1]|nr:hypothetical protein A0O36_00973 [Piscirickettsiaceae bacterium NZ-RLO1]
MSLTEEQLRLIANLLQEQLKEHKDYLLNAIRLTVSQNQDEELEITIRQNQPVGINIVHQAIFETMDIDRDKTMSAKRKEYADNFTKKWLKAPSKEGRCTETIVYTPRYSEKIFDQYLATFLQQDHQIHNQLQTTPLLPELAHEVAEFAIGKGPCANLFYQNTTSSEPEPEPEPEPSSSCCAVL